MESLALKRSISRKRLQNLCIKQRKQIVSEIRNNLRSKVASKNCEKQSFISNDCSRLSNEGTYLRYALKNNYRAALHSRERSE